MYFGGVESSFGKHFPKVIFEFWKTELLSTSKMYFEKHFP